LGSFFTASNPGLARASQLQSHLQQTRGGIAIFSSPFQVQPRALVRHPQSRIENNNAIVVVSHETVGEFGAK
jgi:hypothetical protein